MKFDNEFEKLIISGLFHRDISYSDMIKKLERYYKYNTSIVSIVGEVCDRAGYQYSYISSISWDDVDNLDLYIRVTKNEDICIVLTIRINNFNNAVSYAMLYKSVNDYEGKEIKLDIYG